MRADPQSTQRVDVLSFYVDPYDDGVSPDGIVLLESKARVAEIPLAPDQSDIIPVKDMRHDFGDTKHHEVFYSLLSRPGSSSTSPTAPPRLSGTTAVVMSPRKFAAGTVVVTGTGAAATVTYKEGRDYVEDDTAGSIARISTGSIPDGATVRSVRRPAGHQFQPGTVAHPPTKLGYPVYIPSSVRPPAPAVRYLMPLFRWHKESSKRKTSSGPAPCSASTWAAPGTRPARGNSRRRRRRSRPERRCRPISRRWSAATA